MQENVEPYIKNIVVCNVYWEDFGYTILKHAETSKFVVTLDISNIEFSVDMIKSIKVIGPDNYEFSFLPEKFNFQTLNGYVNEFVPGIFWFQAYDTAGYLQPGEYTITVTFADGRTSSKKKYLQNNTALLSVYKAHEKKSAPVAEYSKMSNSFLELKWKILADVDAYYCTRLADFSGFKGEPLIFSPLVFDNIFGNGEGDPLNTGLNRSRLSVPYSKLSPKSYIWFVEILDSNVFEDIHYVIFQPTEIFRITN